MEQCRLKSLFPEGTPANVPHQRCGELDEGVEGLVGDVLYLPRLMGIFIVDTAL
jgi:hypothetical protein